MPPAAALLVLGLRCAARPGATAPRAPGRAWSGAAAMLPGGGCVGVASGDSVPDRHRMQRAARTNMAHVTRSCRAALGSAPPSRSRKNTSARHRKTADARRRGVAASRVGLQTRSSSSRHKVAGAARPAAPAPQSLVSYFGASEPILCVCVCFLLFW